MQRTRTRILATLGLVIAVAASVMVGCGGASGDAGNNSSSGGSTILDQRLYDLDSVDPEVFEAGEEYLKAGRDYLKCTESYVNAALEDQPELQEELWDSQSSLYEASDALSDAYRKRTDWDVNTELYYQEVNRYISEIQHITARMRTEAEAVGETEVPEGAAEAFIGTWEMKRMEESGEVISEEDVEYMASSGMTVYLELNEDGSATLEMFGEPYEGTWEAESDHAAALTLDGSTYVLTLDGRRMTLEQAGSDTKMEFEQIDPDDKVEPEPEEQSGTSSTSGQSDNGEVDPAVREFCDSYEAFIDEYVAFMQRYNNASTNDQAAMMNDYLNMMTRLGEMMEKEEVFSGAESTWNEATVNYYTEVMLRCSQKMLEAY